MPEVWPSVRPQAPAERAGGGPPASPQAFPPLKLTYPVCEYYQPYPNPQLSMQSYLLYIHFQCYSLADGYTRSIHPVSPCYCQFISTFQAFYSWEARSESKTRPTPLNAVVSIIYIHRPTTYDILFVLRGWTAVGVGGATWTGAIVCW